MGIQPTHELVGMITSSGGDAVQEMKAWVSDWRQRNVLPAASRLRGGARCRAIDTETPAMLLEASSQGASRTVMITCSRAEGVLWRDYIGERFRALTFLFLHVVNMLSYSWYRACPFPYSSF